MGCRVWQMNPAALQMFHNLTESNGEEMGWLNSLLKTMSWLHTVEVKTGGTLHAQIIVVSYKDRFAILNTLY